MHSRRAVQLAALVGVGALLVGCGSKTTSSPEQVQGLTEKSADFIAVATTQDGKSELVLLTGSAAHQKGAGEVSMIATKSQPNHVLFDIKDGKAQVTLPSGGELNLQPDSNGRLTGTGTVTDAAGANIPVQVTGTWNGREEEAIPNSTKCGNLDEKALTIGDPQGAAFTELQKKMQAIPATMSLSEVANQWRNFDAVVVNPQVKGALTSPITRAFMQGSKWVIITAPESASHDELAQLMPVVSKEVWSDSWAVAVRAGDPGGSWNQTYHTVPLYKSAKDPKQAPTEAELAKFAEELHLRGDECVAASATPQASESSAPATPNAPSPASNSTSGQGQPRVQYAQVYAANHDGGVGAQTVAVPASNDSVTDRSNRPLELPSNVFGFSSETHLREEHELPPSRTWSSHPNCRPNLYYVEMATVDKCPTMKDPQVAELSGSDKVLVFLTSTRPASIERGTSHSSSGLDSANVDLRWVVMHQQNTVVNGAINKDKNGSHTMAYPDVTNGAVARTYMFGIRGSEDPLRETSWLMARAHTEVSLGKTAHGTARFATKDESSFPLKTITNTHQSKSLSGSWSVNAGGGTFAAVPIFNLGGSYSKSWSEDTSLSVPSWEVIPSYDSKGVNIAWNTNTTKAGKSASFEEYQAGKVDTYGYNPLNVSGLVADSTYAWQSPCMFGKSEVTVDREVSFASVFNVAPMIGDDSGPKWRNVNAGPKAYNNTLATVNHVVPWSLKKLKYHIDFDSPVIALYPHTIDGFKGITPNGEPVVYRVKGCETDYPMPASLKAEIAERDAKVAAEKAKAAAQAKAAKEAADAKAKAEQDAVNAKAKAEKEKAEKAEKDKAEKEKAQKAKSQAEAAADAKYAHIKRKSGCYNLPTDAEVDDCLDVLERRDG